MVKALSLYTEYKEGDLVQINRPYSMGSVTADDTPFAIGDVTKVLEVLADGSLLLLEPRGSAFYLSKDSLKAIAHYQVFNVVPGDYVRFKDVEDIPSNYQKILGNRDLLVTRLNVYGLPTVAHKGGAVTLTSSYLGAVEKVENPVIQVEAGDIIQVFNSLEDQFPSDCYLQVQGTTHAGVPIVRINGKALPLDAGDKYRLAPDFSEAHYKVGDSVIVAKGTEVPKGVKTNYVYVVDHYTSLRDIALYDPEGGTTEDLPSISQQNLALRKVSIQ